MRGLNPHLSPSRTIDRIDHPTQKIPLSCGVLSLDDPWEFARLVL
jgi:hypothetical protein